MIDAALIFEKSHLQPGMHIADFGCGRTGHIVFSASLRVGEMGIVYAVDILKDVLEEVRKRAAFQRLHNIHTVWSDIERVGSTAIPAKSLDQIFIINVLCRIKERGASLDEAHRLLKDKARLIVVDWTNNQLPIAPSSDQLVDFDTIRSWAISHGYAVQEQFEAGAYHTGMVLFKHE